MRLVADFEIKSNYKAVMELMQTLNQEGYSVNVSPRGDKLQLIVTEQEDDD